MENGNCWYQDQTFDFSMASFSTHSWLAYEGTLLFSSPSKIIWLSNNIQQYWHGVEAPYNSDICTACENISSEDYGDIEQLTLKFDSTGTIILNDSLAIRAMEEYSKLVSELQKVKSNFQIAAFYAGAMTHYISQASSWFTLWNETLWGPVDYSKYVQFEQVIEDGLDASSSIDPKDTWKHNYLELHPNCSEPIDGYETTINLGRKCYPYIEFLQENYTETTTIEEWSKDYRNTVEYILSLSVEAIYSAIESAMKDVNWKYLSIPDPNYSFNNGTAHLEIPAFEVTFRDNIGEHTLNESVTSQAKFYLVDYQYDESNALYFPSISTTYYNLTYLENNWLFPDQIISGLATYTNYSIIYYFQLLEYPPTWSNLSQTDFHIDYYSLEISSYTANYNWDDWNLDIENILVTCPDITEIGVVEINDIVSAEWILYTAGESNMIGNIPLGVQAIDRDGNFVRGNLEYNDSTKKWFSVGNDLGKVFNHPRQVFYVVVRFNLTKLPVGTWFNFTNYYSSHNYFIPYAQSYSENIFTVRNHKIFSTKPDIVYNAEEQTVSAYNITAYVDYHTTTLDYYEMVQKPYNNSADERRTRFRILPDRDLSDYKTDPPLGDLSWNAEQKFWYFENIDVSNLRPGKYYTRCFFFTMNTNVTDNTYGPYSDIFIIKRDINMRVIVIPSVAFLITIIIIPIIFEFRRKTRANRLFD